MDQNQIKNKKDSKKHHHHHKQRQLSIPDKINQQNYIIKNNNKIHKHKLENIDMKLKHIKDSIQENSQTNKKEKHLHRNRSTNMFDSKKDKDYMKYKLEKYAQKEEKKEKRYIVYNVNNNMPKNVDKNTEKYFLKKYNNLSQIHAKKEKTQYIENKKNNIESSENNLSFIQKKDKHKNENEYIENNNYINNNYNNLKKSNVNSKEKQKNKNNIIEGELNLSQENYKNNKEKIENNNKEEERPRKRDRIASMKMSSKYSEKMQSQIAEEREKLLIEQQKLEKKKLQLYHMEEIKKKESFAQETFIKQFLSYLTNYVDYGRISSLIPGGYIFLQDKLIYLDLLCTEEQFNYVYNKKNFYKSKNAKELCRNGIPLKFMKIFFKKLLNLENCKENYELKYNMTIKNLDPRYLGDYVPYFCGPDKKKLREVLPIHYLNEEGITALKTIMWLISDLVPKIEYCPLLIKICSILLIFLEKEEAYEAMRTLIEMNYKPAEIYKVKWHFRFSIMENNKLSESIKIFLENESFSMQNLFMFFKQNGLEPNLLIKDFCENLFLNYLNFYAILRFICIFIYEGSKSLYRFTYGVLNYIFEKKFEEVKENKKHLILKIREALMNVTDYKSIFEDAFKLKVNRNNNGYIKDNLGEPIAELQKPFEAPSNYNTENDNESQNDSNKNIMNLQIKENNKNKRNEYLYEYYLPKIEPKSNILKTKEIIGLFDKLPNNLKHNDLATIYSLSKKKINMKSILELSKKYSKSYSILLIIETGQNELFGVIMPKMLQQTEENEYIELDNCCLVNFRPKLNIYKDNYSKGINMLCCNKKGLWFCKQDVGDLIYIDGSLSEGRTCKNNTYFGPITLTQKDNFIIKDLEIIVFVQNYS